MDGRGAERGPLQLDIGIVVSGLGGTPIRKGINSTDLFPFLVLILDYISDHPIIRFGL